MLAAGNIQYNYKQQLAAELERVRNWGYSRTSEETLTRLRATKALPTPK